MGVEFPSRTPEQRAEVGNLISLLRNSSESMLELSVSPRALTADATQFVHGPEQTSGSTADTAAEELEDPLLELLRQGTTLQENDFFAELRRQRSGESVAS
jgi:hypothetical protein